MEELLYFSLIRHKRMSPSEALGPPLPTPTSVASTSAQSLTAEPTAISPQPADQDVATEPSEAKPEPLIATPSKAKTSSKKKPKKKKYIFFIFRVWRQCFKGLCSYFVMWTTFFFL